MTSPLQLLMNALNILIGLSFLGQRSEITAVAQTMQRTPARLIGRMLKPKQRLCMSRDFAWAMESVSVSRFVCRPAQHGQT